MWVFSNQIEDSLRDYQPGEVVHLTMRNGRFLGVGYVNPHSLISARLLTREEREIDADFFCQQIIRAQELRQKILPDQEAVREIFSESDGLPGLIVDRYGELLVVQINTAGMERQKELLVSCLQRVFQPRGIFERSDAGVRKLEELEPQSGILEGEIPEEPVWIKYAGMPMPVDVRRGQKTGLYLDQRMNLEMMAPLAQGARVLDAFSYTGAWGLKAAKSGAAEVVFLDASKWALEQAQAAARRARVAGKCRTIIADAFAAMKKLADDKEKFDLVILDPPSFIKSRSHFKEGYRGYFDVNQRALALVQKGGYFVSSSCSHHLDEATFTEMLLAVLRRAGRESLLLFKGRQGPDHPVLPQMPETEYLHCQVLQVF